MCIIEKKRVVAFMNEFLTSIVKEPATFLTAGHFLSTGKWIHKDRIIDSHEIIFVLKGVLYIQIGDKKYEAKENTFLLIPSGVRHFGTNYCPENTSFYWFHFLLPSNSTMMNGDLIKQRLEKTYTAEPIIVLPLFSDQMNSSRLNILFNQLLDIVKNKRGNKFYLNYFVTSILMEVSEETLDYQIYHNPEEKNSRTLLFIMEWIRMNIDKELTLDSIAREFNYSKAYLSRFFSEQTGYTLTQFIRKTRIERSKSLLLSLPLTIEEVASRCGFSDQKYFMKSFKRVENMTPSQFREAYRKTRLNND